jgi:error-prone DNA polymerase
MKGGLALRLGLRQIKGFSEKHAEKLLAARGNGYFDAASLWRKSGLAPAALETLARADAFGSMGLKRREALWAVQGLKAAPLPLFAAMGAEEQSGEPEVALPEMPLGAEVIEDYAALHLSLKCHPMALLRDVFAGEGAVAAARLAEIPHGSKIAAAGLVLVRQRPGSAKGVIFMTLEDETGVTNVIVWPKTYERFRRTVIASRLVAVTGTLQREGIVTHLVAEKLVDCTERLHWLREGAFDGEGETPAPPPSAAKPPFSSRDFH